MRMGTPKFKDAIRPINLQINPLLVVNELVIDEYLLKINDAFGWLVLVALLLVLVIP